MATAVPTTFGKYRMLDLLGEGGMGAVYCAEDTVLLRRVAVKVMTEAIARQTPLRNRFLREARAAGSLQHANVVTVYDFGEVEGHLFIAMELVDGADLEHLLAQQQPVTLDAKLDIIADVLAGLGYAHRHGVVHRDIKPPNIRITRDGRAKIMDFGIAYVGASDLTGTGLAIGTPSYMAPEQITGGTVSAASDLFALGVVMYELLAGVRPFVGESVHSILFKIVSADPPDLHVLIPGVSPALVAVVARALQKDPADRYQSAQEMAQDLAAARAAALRDGMAPAAPAGEAEAPPVADGERARAEPTASPVAVASTTGGAVSGAFDPATRTPTSAPRSSRALWISGASAACLLGAVALWATRGRSAAIQPDAGAAVARTTSAPASSAPVAPASSAPASTEATRSAGAATSSVLAPAPAVAVPVTAGASANAPAPAVARPPARGPAGAGTLPAPTRPTAAAQPPTAGPVSAAAVTTPVPRAATPGVAAPTSPPGTASPGTDRPAGPGTAPADAAAAPSPAAIASEIGDAARAYARAIESRDIAAVRRAYPGLTDAQERGFRQFFDVARNLHVAFSVSGVDATGNSADAHLTGTYDYSTPDGQHQRQPVDFAATLRRDATGWRFTSVR